MCGAFESTISLRALYAYFNQEKRNITMGSMWLKSLTFLHPSPTKPYLHHGGISTRPTYIDPSYIRSSSYVHFPSTCSRHESLTRLRSARLHLLTRLRFFSIHSPSRPCAYACARQPLFAHQPQSTDQQQDRLAQQDHPQRHHCPNHPRDRI